MLKTKYIFITGGVVSSLGKGLIASGLASLLEERGFSINISKFDPYFNIDSGTMNPIEHGEVYVLNDGTETDLDLGNYERFTNLTLSSQNTLTSGKIYSEVIRKERKGDYLGQTVQVIPHITNEIKKIIYNYSKCDLQIIEIGGTIGDIEGLPFLEAIRQFSLEIGRENTVFIHITLLPYIKHAKEIKTKPSQQSVAKLREIGIQPDILVCRSENKINKEIKEKLSLFCNVPIDHVITDPDIKNSIYEIPVILYKEKLDILVIKKLNLPYLKENPAIKWINLLNKIKNITNTIKIGLIGKYTKLQESYKSVYESIYHSSFNNNCNSKIIIVDSSKINHLNYNSILNNLKLDCIIIPGGFGKRGIEGMINACKYARENKIPFLGLCLGMQIAIIEFARNVIKLQGANSIEFDIDTIYPVIDLMKDQKNNIHENKGGTMRLGSYSCNLKKESKSFKIYNKNKIYERHRHRYEFNNKFRNLFIKHGLIIAGENLTYNLVEIIEIKNHPFFIASQFHPEFQSKPNNSHPLFDSFIKSAIEYNKQK